MIVSLQARALRQRTHSETFKMPSFPPHRPPGCSTERASLKPPPLQLVSEERALEGSEGRKEVLEKCVNVAGVLRSHCVLRKQPTLR